MVHTRFSSVSPSVAEGSVSHSKRKFKIRAKKMKGKQLPSPVKHKRCRLIFEDNLFPPPKGMMYEINVENHKSAKISTLNKYDAITDIRNMLSAKQLKDFSDSCFGYFMKIPHFKLQHQLIHNLLLRQLKQCNPNELWIGVGGKKLKFGLEAFATVTGLLCVGNSDKMRYSKPDNAFISTYFEGSNSVSKSSVKKVFFAKQWKTDADAVKIAKLYLLHHFLLCTATDTHIPKGDLDLLDGEEFDQYPWGKEVFKFTLDCLKNNAKTTSKDNYYRLNGFPYAFQVWFYECCVYMNGKYCQKEGDLIPRLMNWSSDSPARFEDVYTTLSLDAKELQIKSFNPTVKEIEDLQLNELLRKKESLSVRSSENHASDDDFVAPVSASIKGVASSSTPSNNESSIKKIISQMRKLEASQRDLVGEVKALKSIVNEQRSYFDSEMSKLRDMIEHKYGFENEVVDKTNVGRNGDEVANKTNVERNEDGFVFDDEIGEKDTTMGFDDVANECATDGATLAGEDVHVTSNEGGTDVATDVATPDDDDVHVGGEDLSDDFSPETLNGIEDVFKKLEEDSIQKQKELVVESAPNGETAEKVGTIFNSTELFSPDVERIDFMINEVIAPEVELPVAGSAEDFVMQVVREVAELQHVEDEVDDLENAFEKSMATNMKDAGVNFAGSGTSGLVKLTPALPKRAIRLPSYLQSPFLQHFGSSSKSNTENVENKDMKGVNPLDSNIGELPDMDTSSDFYEWLEAGLLMKKNKKKFYSKEGNIISPPLMFGSNIVTEKTWFHILEYGSSTLSYSHVDVFFYYLRKMSKDNPNCGIKFTTTNCTFQNNMISMYENISETDETDAILSKIKAKKGILDVIDGTALPFGTSWSEVDFVLFPVLLPEQEHWLLGIFSLHERQIVICNTMPGRAIGPMITNEFIPFSTMLPYYLQLTDFYSRSDTNFSANLLFGEVKG